MAKNVVSTPHAPAAIGPYSQAVQSGDWVFLSGQIPLDPASGELIGEDIAGQTRRVMENLAAVLHAAHCTFDDIVKATIYLVDLGDFASVNQVYGQYFTGTFPARATLQVSALPRGARVEIEAVARVP
jgi:2-iminobutanoate/2-iminopropanoate deaminase